MKQYVSRPRPSCLKSMCFVSGAKLNDQLPQNCPDLAPPLMKLLVNSEMVTVKAADSIKKPIGAEDHMLFILFAL